VNSRDLQQLQIQDHANKMGKLYLAQAATSAMPYLALEQSQLQQYADTLAAQPVVKNVQIYDITGQEMASSAKAQSINDLFGISVNKVNQIDDIVPFVQELRTEELQGYIRLSLYRTILTDELADNSRVQYDIMRLFLIVAGFIGFLLTRGLNRFSRQGFRPPKSRRYGS